MPIHTRKNPYLGVNAHANSWLLDTEREWPSFHSAFIIRMTDNLNDVLPPGYEARPERSLITRETLPGLENKPKQERLRCPQPDTTIYKYGENQANAPMPGSAQAPSLLLTAREAMSDREGDPNAVIIYNVKLGKSATRIELLSPSNKPPANENESYCMAGYEAYNIQRELALRSGTFLIEIDLIHTALGDSAIKQLP